MVYIPAYGRVATPEGIRLGATVAEVERAYPSFDLNGADQDPFAGTGRAVAGWADRYEGVHYRFGFDHGKLVELALEHDHEDCYE